VAQTDRHFAHWIDSSSLILTRLNHQLIGYPRQRVRACNRIHRAVPMGGGVRSLAIRIHQGDRGGGLQLLPVLTCNQLKG